MCNRFEVFWIYTIPDTAQMVYIQTFRVMSSSEFVSNPVRSTDFALEVNPPVSFVVLRPFPPEAVPILCCVG